jgi:hypothetical protein
MGSALLQKGATQPRNERIDSSSATPVLLDPDSCTFSGLGKINVMHSLGVMKALNLELREESDTLKWEEHLKSISSTPFFATSWIECFRDKNRRPIYQRFISKGDTVGLAAGLAIEPPNVLLRKFFRTLFFFSGPAVIENDSNLTRMCLSKMVRFARENRYTHINFCSYDYPYELNLEGLPFKPSTRMEYVLDMQSNPAGLKKKMKKRMTDVRKAEKNGLGFYESSSPKTLQDLLFLLEETRSIRRSKNYDDYSYFYLPYLGREILYKLFDSGIVRIFYVAKEDHVLCVELTAVHHRRAYGLLVGTDEQGYELKANALLQFNVIQKLKSESIQFYNFGGVPRDPSSKGLAFFKASFGGKEYNCTGGMSRHLQKPFIEYLTNAYSKLPNMKLTKIIRKGVRGNDYVL